MAFFAKLKDYNTDMRQEVIEIYTAVMQSKLLRDQHILPHVTTNNTRIVSLNFF
ncbi:Zinc knuckle family protein, partial [Perilla frutescens var. hirtella]